MRKTILWVSSLLLLGTLFNACSTDVDLYADYKDITVVYGLLDYGKDTNYVKINKAFLGPGNAYNIALIADSCNYPYKLDAKIIEHRAPSYGSHYVVTKTFDLDTMTIHTKEPGLFYAPDQLVYYTAERIKSNTDDFKYKYELQIDRGDTLLTAETAIVGGDAFMIDAKALGFNAETGTVKWYECPNAEIYEVSIKFYFTETRPGQEPEQRCMTWSLGNHPVSTLTIDHGKYALNYKSSVFFAHLASFIGNDTLPYMDVKRTVANPCLGVVVSAGGEELYNYISVNSPSSSIVQSIPEYTNINGGGYGVFSSRATKEQRVNMTSFTSLFDHENWGFQQGK